MEKGHRGKGAGQKDRGLKKNNLIIIKKGRKQKEDHKRKERSG